MTAPDFSIIIPTFARPAQLASCLEALVRLDYSREGFEVIVVDDGGKTPPDVIKSAQDRVAVTLLSQTHAGPAAARNAGAMRARGKYLAFTDDDCLPAENWLQALKARFDRAPDHLIGGRVVNGFPENPYSTAAQLLVDYVCGYYNSNGNQTKFFASNNLAVPADRFHAIGGFDTSFPLAAAEDREFSDRWQHYGYTKTYAPEVSVCHASALTLHSFCRQQFRYGRGAFGFHQARACRKQNGIRLEPASFYLRLLQYPLRHEGWGVPGLALALLLLLSQGAVATGFLVEMLMRRCRGQTNRP